VASKEIGLEVNAEKTRYIVTSRDQDAGQSQNIKTYNSSFERLEQFICLGTNLTNRNYIRGAMKGSLKSGNVCYLSLQNLLSSSFLSKNTKIKTYRIII
jgi:hypothetical protein